MRQNSHMAFPFSVQEVIQMGRHPHRTGNQDNETAQIMALCDCQALANRDYRQLSGGEQQRVQLARLLVQLWEPTPHRNGYFLMNQLRRWIFTISSTCFVYYAS